MPGANEKVLGKAGLTNSLSCIFGQGKWALGGHRFNTGFYFTQLRSIDLCEDTSENYLLGNAKETLPGLIKPLALASVINPFDLL